jgi:RimJ/RimL family protein N-acetyltransferase
MRLELEQCVLRDWQDDDAPALAEGANNRKVWLNLRDFMPHPYSLEDAKSYLCQLSQKPEKKTFCIEIDGRVAGAVGLNMQADVHRLTAELGYWLAEPFWGRGVMTGAV